MKTSLKLIPDLNINAVSAWLYRDKSQERVILIFLIHKIIDLILVSVKQTHETKQHRFYVTSHKFIQCYKVPNGIFPYLLC